jgi:dolichol-phosphate mannosyltransferase
MNQLASPSSAPDIRTERSGRVLISVVFSFRNEAETIPALISRLEAVFAGENVQYELLFVNDASTDASLAILMKERERNPRVKVLNMSRRFGVPECLMAGMAFASGDALVYLDTDLQDPPELISTLIARWRAGADVVHTVRTRRRGENPMKMWATAMAYRLIQFGSPLKLPVDAGDFKLLSRNVVMNMLRLRETDPYMRGLVVWLGFNQAFVPYERVSRHAGSTHFPFFSRGPWKTFIVGLTSFSFLPVYACGVLAAAGLAVSFSLLIATLVLLVRGSAFTSSVALGSVIAFMWATTMGATAIVGLYITRIYKDVRGRPPYVVQSAIGISMPGPAERDDRSMRAERTQS